MKVKIIQLEIRQKDEWNPVLLLADADELHRDILSSYLEKNKLGYREIKLKSGQTGPSAHGVNEGYYVNGMGDGVYDPSSVTLRVKRDSSSYDYGTEIDIKKLRQYLDGKEIKIEIM